MSDYERIAKAIAYIGENVTAQPSLDDLATRGTCDQRGGTRVLPDLRQARRRSRAANGRRARVGYLTNMPRTYGVSVRFNF